LEEPVSDDINDLSDNSILEFAENLNGAEGYSKDNKTEDDATEKKTKENKSNKNSTKEQKDEKIVIPELDDTTAMLAYTQEIKDSAGVKDSFTEEKTDAIKKQE